MSSDKNNKPTNILGSGISDAQKKQTQLSRILLMLLVAGTLIVGIQLELYSLQQWLFVPVLLVYVFVAQIIESRLHKRSSDVASRVMLQTDAFVIGLSITALHFSLIPSLMFFITVNALAMAAGGMMVWLYSMVSVVLALVLGAFIFGIEILHYKDTPMYFNIISIMGVGTYMGVNAFYAQEQTRQLKAAQYKIQQQQNQSIELSRKLAKYLPPQVWGSIFSGKRDAKLETRRRKLTIFFSDLKGFSSMSEEVPLSTLTTVLNSYLNEMTKVALDFGGTIDKFMGDGIMIFFGDPNTQGTREDAVACVSMAIEMQRRMVMLRHRWQRDLDFKFNLEVRMGVNSGVCTVGNFGADTRLDYTILGTDVNLASRLESSAQPGHILISASTNELVKSVIRCRGKGDIMVKGFAKPQPVFEVVDFIANLSGNRNYFSIDKMGISMTLDLSKVPNYEKQAVAKDLINFGKHLSKDQEFQLHSESKGFFMKGDTRLVRKAEREEIVETLKVCLQGLKNKLNA